ncbi:MAG: arylsulfatase [Bryobacterales bacterium]|nr:arylsulfatase [Bryobacterales bacterium]
MTRRSFFFAGLAAGPSKAAQRRDRPNLLMIMGDQHRGDCLGAAGHPVVRTPNLDRLAREGALFRNAYSSTPTCTPARSALLTGLAPWHHGMLGYGRVAQKYPFEKPQALRDAGFHTFAVGKNHFHPQRHPHGYEHVMLDESGRAESPEFRSDYRSWFHSEAPGEDPDATGIGWNDYRAKAYVLPERLHPTRWTGDVAVRFLESYNRSEPFFLKVSFARPHSPYDPPERFFRMYENAAIPRPAAGAWAARNETRNDGSFNIWRGNLGEEQARHSRKGYYGSVSFVDEQVGRILDTLEKRGLLDRTLILYFSDHGDMTGDHHLWRKGYAYEPAARIPMLMRWPEGLATARRGTVFQQPVELRDVLPTLLDAASIRTERRLDGASLLRLASSNGSGWREFIDLEHDICYDRSNHWNALTDGRWKYIYHALDGAEQLFDLTRDRQELRDLSGEAGAQETLRLWRGRLIQHLAGRGEPFVRGGGLAPRPESTLYSPHYPRPSAA